MKKKNRSFAVMLMLLLFLPAGWIFSQPNWPVVIYTNSTTAMGIVTIDGLPASAGDMVGAFVGTECRATGTVLINQGTAYISFLIQGESVDIVTFKVWDASQNTILDVTYSTQSNPGGIIGLSPNFLPIAAVSVGETQAIALPLGWYMFSTYINPTYPLMDSLFADILSDVMLVKNGSGTVFWPAFGVNLIGSLSVCEGYLIKMSATGTLLVEGIAVQPENTPCNIPAGWSLISYLRKTPGDLVSMVSTIASEILLIKDYVGQVYWPVFGVNLIGNLNPGQGYQTKLSNAGVLTYPSNTINYSKVNISRPIVQHFSSPVNTGNNMTLGIKHNGLDMKNGDEIAVFGESGLLVGVSVVADEFTSITIWGDDEITPGIDGLQDGEEFSIQVYRRNLQGFENIEGLDLIWIEGDGFYKDNGIAVVEKIHEFPLQHGSQLFQNSPNPFSDKTEFSFYLPEDCFVELEVFNLLGERVALLISEKKPYGRHSIVYNNNELMAGTYFYRIRTLESDSYRIEQTRQMVILDR